MANRSMKRFLYNLFIIDVSSFKKRHGSCQGVVYNLVNRFQSKSSKSDTLAKEIEKEAKETPAVSSRSEVEKRKRYEDGVENYSSGDEDTSDRKWRLDLAWLTKALEPALQLRRWALPTGNGAGMGSPPPSSRSLAEIITSIQRSKIGVEGWTLGDLTIGLYLIYLRQASLGPFEDIKGVQVLSDSTVHDLVYHAELAKGCYKDTVTGVAKNSMLRESNILKFVKDSSVMRPGYYIGIDHCRKLVVLGIRGTHTIYDLITDIVYSSEGEVTFEGYSTHFGTGEAARWFLSYELGTLRKCLEKYEGYKLRLVGHSLGGAIASLLAIMLRKKSQKELGFNPRIVSAVGYATPPSVSKDLAEGCSDFVKTVVMQDDIIPRLSTASLAKLRNEIVQTDWTSVIEKEEWKALMDLVTNAKQVVSSLQDLARKLSEYTKFRNKKDSSDSPIRNKLSATATSSTHLSSGSTTRVNNGLQKKETVIAVPEELYVPGTVYYLKRNLEGGPKGTSGNGKEYFTLWKRDSGQHFQRIVLSGNFISDHKCDSHYYALRDVLKGLPVSIDEEIFK